MTGRLLAGGILLLALASCDPDRVYEEKLDYPGRHWMVKDTAHFSFRLDNDQLRYNLKMDLRNSLEYPWSRIFVEMRLADSTGAVVERKLIHADLFDEKTGQPFGQSGLGDVFDHRVPLLENYSFRYPGAYRLTLIQMMRKDTLEGVLSVGARLERVQTP